jgi:RNA polymerase sigma factor (sigma-70 family)
VFTPRTSERSTITWCVAPCKCSALRCVTEDIEIEPLSDPDIRLADYVGGGLAREERQRRDHALVARVRSGDHDAFTALYTTYRARLYRLAYEYRDDGDEADDVVEDVFAKIWDIHEDWHVDTTIAAYLCTAVRYRSTDLFRRVKAEKRRRAKLAGPPLRVVGGGPEGVEVRPPAHGPVTGDAAFNSGERRLFETDLKRAIDAAVAVMPPKCREVFQISRCMSGDEALSYAEIGEVLKIVPSTVRQHLIKALDILEARLEAAGWPNVLRRQDRGRLSSGRNGS